MITNSGVVVDPGMDSAPTARDVAVAMCRITRWAGAVWCPLSAHSLLVAELTAARGASPDRWAPALLHDAHETVTGEIVRAWKAPEMKTRERELDGRILRAFGLPRDAVADPLIKECDERSLICEAAVLGVPGFPAYYGARHPGYAPATAEELRLAESILRSDWTDPSSVMPGSPQAARLERCLAKIMEGNVQAARLEVVPGAKWNSRQEER